ncbi:hypothetical protein [Streptomyces misionensis]|uniref:hypothetical protein n=1 Tax=Streptomyces misionensis TaxID=67331 RepID=UPI003673E394
MLVQHSTGGDGLVLALLTVRLLGPSAGAIAVIALLAVLVGSRRTADGRLPGLIGRGTLTRPGAWHVYGSLMTDVERLLYDLDHVGAR